MPFVLLLSLVLGVRAAAPATSFTVNRVQVFLSARAKSQTLVVRNVSTEPLRFQLDVFAWDQNLQGEMGLTPTRDIVFFPPLFALAPNEERTVRIGTVVPPAPAETTYRLFIEELPPTDGASPRPAGQVNIRTRLGIPIFLQPRKEVTGGHLEGLALRDGRVSFAVRNTGNVHFVVQAVRITGHGAGGETVFEGALEGWYVLAGGGRLYDLAVPVEKCPVTRAVAVEVHTTRATFTDRAIVPPNACGG